MPDLSEFHNLDDAAELRRIIGDLERRLRRAKAKTDDLVDATLNGAKDAMTALGPVPPVPEPKASRSKGKPEVALWHLTDWQGSKVTTSYNSDVMRERIMRYCDIAEKITQIQRADHPVDEGVILFGGDIIEGLFQYPTQPFEIDATIFDQYTRAARLVVDVVRRALAVYSRVRVIGEWGNHGRIGSKRMAVPASDNFDRMIYHLARELLADEKRLSWQDGPEDMQRVEIGEYRALLFHGDEVGRHGYASPATIVKHVAQWKSGAYPWRFTDAYYGHLHNHQEWALPDGEGAVYATGAAESDNRYARTMMAAAAKPTQRLHFIVPDKGRVGAQYKVRLSEDGGR